MSIRILHFSDFHLNGNKLAEAKSNMHYMLKALEDINNQKKIDLIVYSGDLLEEGGAGYNKSLTKGFKAFTEEVITPITAKLGLDNSRFIFAPGNHDINRDKIDEMYEAGIEENTKDFQSIVAFTKRPKIDTYTERINEFKDYESSYYSTLENVTYRNGRFVSTFEYEIDGQSVGVSSLNNVWRCGPNDKNKIALGINQITEHAQHLEGKKLRIAVMHYPISFLKETERNIVMEKCAENFDVVFCGHSHEGFVNLHVPLPNNAFLEVNTAGTLAANTYTHDSRHKNSFQIIDCEAGIQYCVQKYYQRDFQQFVLDIRPEYPDGNNVRIYPDSQLIKTMYDNYIEALHRSDELKIKIAIAPFEPLNDFINRKDNLVMKPVFRKGARLERVMSAIQNSMKDCRLMALSGMGKTRIIAETFRDFREVYYSRESNCTKGLKTLLDTKKPDIVIVDNCNSDALKNINKCIDESEASVRLITIYNVLTPEEEATRGEEHRLEYADTEEVVEAMLASEESIQGNELLISGIRERSGRIPYMTLLLLEAYRKNGNLSLDNADEALSSILSGNEKLDANKGNVLKTLALFDPIGFEGNISDEINFVKKINNLHHIALNQEPIDCLFNDTIQEYLGRQLIEKDGYCIRLRPRPLAEWLTETWLVEYGNSMADILEVISNLKTDLSGRLFHALDNRFREMGTSLNAKKVFDQLHDPKYGSFHNERIVFSKEGSRLFLSMALVSPVMVSKNLLDLIGKKSIGWLRDEMNEDARRNLVWALENVCLDADAFLDGAKCLAKLALAESENISNNATGQFLQLFHVFLSGTKADLKQRITLIQHLRSESDYLPLLVKAIGRAFTSRGFYRAYTSGRPNISDKTEDYQPNLSEIKFYWRDCSIVLSSIIEQDESLIPSVIEMLPNHVSDFGHLREMPLLYKMIEHYGKFVDYQWPKMRDNLNLYLNYWFEGPEEKKNDVIFWIDKLSPKTFLGRLKVCIKDSHIRIGKNLCEFEASMISFMNPFAEEFIEKKIYETDEYSDILFDNKLQLHWFIKCVVNKVNEENNAKELLKYTFSTIENQPTNCVSGVVPSLVGGIEDKQSVTSFYKKLRDKGYYNVYASVIGTLDNDNHVLLKTLLEEYVNNVVDNECLNNYLRFYQSHTAKNIFELFDLMKGSKTNAKEVLYPYFLNYIVFSDLKEDKDYLSKEKDILLKFDFNDSYPNLSRQVVDLMQQLLDKEDDSIFALAVHKKISEYLCQAVIETHPFENIYSSLLPKYQNAILPDLCELLSAQDEKMRFYYNMYLNLGSGFESGRGPLFQCDEEKLKEACFKYPSVIPIRFAQMCPVYHFADGNSEKRFSDFFLWLCDNFGNQKDMLLQFSSNMGTFSWIGQGGFSDFVAERIPCLIPLTKHSNPIVKEWAEREMEEAKKEVIREKGREAYERMVR